MKIKIIDVDYVTDEELITLRECGIGVGDIVDVIFKYNNGDVAVRAIRDTEFVNVGNEVIIRKFE
ncbi:hypothetical protein [Escherichia coli]|uniref:hypothetical protein n=1 Tax=Escherichia coli TaxID=562 RepID=UPI0010B6CEF0|nr:hypothetical protein [Escherichia coli]GCG53727.1 hypothetical protein BvCms16BK_04536 [Escherichia coli]